MELIPILKWRAKITHHGAPGEGPILKIWRREWWTYRERFDRKTGCS